MRFFFFKQFSRETMSTIEKVRSNAIMFENLIREEYRKLESTENEVNMAREFLSKTAICNGKNNSNPSSTWNEYESITAYYCKIY